MKKKVRIKKLNKKALILLSSFVLLIGIIIYSGIKIFSNKNINDSKILAYIYDGEKHDMPPEKDSGYEIDVVNCDKAVGEWNNTTWTLTLSEIEGKTSCIATFKKESKKRTIHLDPNGGTYNGTTGMQDITIDEDGVIHGIPTRKGYKFVGWEIEGEGATIEGNRITNFGTGEITLKPKWEKEKYTITIVDENGNTRQVEVEYEGRIELVPPEKEGYTFIGWETTSGRIEGNTFICDAEGAKITPKFQANNYDYIVYHKLEGLNGEYTIKDSETFSASYNKSVSPNTKSYEGFTSPSKKTITITTENNKVEYKYTRNKYQLRINPGEGSTSTELEQEVKYEQQVEIKSPTRTGYTFTGWSGATLQDEKLTIPARDVNLTANYKANTYTITYDANGGSVSSSQKQVTYDSTYGELPTPSRVGHNFTGWYINGNKIDANTKVKITSSTSIVAHWTKGTYTLSINPNGGTYKGSSGVYEEGMEYDQQITIESPTKEGYTFNDFDVEGQGSSYNSNTKVFKMGSANATLTAKWTINKYTIIVIDENGNEVEQEVEYGTTITLEEPKRDGYTFIGWETEDGTPIEGNTITIGVDNPKVRPKYVANNYDYIVYHNKMNVDGLTYSRVDADTYKGSSAYGTVVVTNAKVYEGFKEESNKSITIGVENNNPPTKNVVNYNYERNKYQLSINTNGGTYNGNTTQNLYYEQEVTLNSPTKEGYNFSGWSKTSGTITDNKFKMAALDATVTANYTAKKYVVTFDANEGSVTTNSKEVTYDSTYGDLPTPIRTDYNFLGWYTDKTNGTKIESTTQVKTADNHTLYAHWDANFAMFDTGFNVNKVFKNISEDDDTWQIQNITSIERSNTLSNTSNNVSVDGKPIYIWYDNGIIKWYSNASKIYLNENSSFMFRYLSNINSLDLSKFNTSKVKNMQEMFRTFGGETLNLSSFNTSNVTNMSWMFIDSRLKSLNLSSFDTSNVTNMNSMFANMSNLTNLDLSTFNTTKVTDMRAMFNNLYALTSLDISSFNTSNVKDMSYMFHQMRSLTYLDLNNFNTSNVTNMSSMFSEMSELTSLDLSKFDTSRVTDMSGMFRNMKKLTSLDLSNFNTSNVTRICDRSYEYKDGQHVWYMGSGAMFEGCSSLTSLNLSNFNTSKITNMDGLFQDMNSLTTLDISSFDTSKVTDMSLMFHNDSNLLNLDLSSFDTSSTTTSVNMFDNCSKLKTIYVSNKWNINNTSYTNGMFNNNTSLVGGSGTTFNSSYLDKTRAHIDGGTSNPGYLTYKPYNPTAVEYINYLGPTDDSLLTDATSDNNLRYVGSNPNNYVKFNNELWRIIGVMNNIKTGGGQTQSLLKIRRAESLGSYSWDTTTSDINYGSGINQWGASGSYEGADLMRELNYDYLSNVQVGTDGKWFSGSNNAKTADMPTSTISSTSQAMIESVVWNLGSPSNDNGNYDSNWFNTTSGVTAPTSYTRERANTNGKMCSNEITCNDEVTRTSSWTGKVGLFYLSDYLYATSGGTTTNRNTCLTTPMNSWNDSAKKDCKNNDWLFDSSNVQWTLSPSAYWSAYSYNANYVFDVLNSNFRDNVGSNNAFNANGVSPVVFLKSSVNITSGSGTQSDPYILAMP